MTARRYSIVALACAVLLLSFGIGRLAHADPGISLVGTNTDVTNFSSSGLTRGRLGYWFPNFANPSSSKLAPIPTKLVDEFPDWIVVDYDTGSPTYSFALDSPSSAFATGGQVSYNNFTLPNGTTGLSGQLIDDMNSTGTQSNNIISGIAFTADAPSAFLLTVILDNAPTSEFTSVSRMRVRNDSPGGAMEAEVTLDGLYTGLTHNGTADAHQFKLTGVVPDGFFKIQLRTPGNPTPQGADTSLGGILIDPVTNGDFNLDLKVDGGDYTIWADHYLETGVGYLDGDANIDGVVNGGDYTTWADNYAPAAFASASAVPEPSTVASLAVATMLIAASRCLRKRARLTRAFCLRCASAAGKVALVNGYPGAQ